MRKRMTLCLQICALLVIMAGGPAFAQGFPTAQGSKLLSGAFSFSSAGGELYEIDDDRTTTLGLSSSVGYFITPGFALGGELMFLNLSAGDASSSTWGIGPQMIFFIGGDQPKMSIKGSTYPYLSLKFLYVHESYDNYDDLSISGTMIGFGGGFITLLTTTVGLFGEASYQIDNMTATWEDDDWGDNKESASGNQILVNFGFKFFIY